MHDRLDEVMARARAEGLLPDDAVRPGGEQRPWPVVLLTALGAWLAAAPLLGVVGMLLGPLIDNPLGPYLAGGLLLAGSVVVLRSSQVPLFVEQLAVPGVLVGGGALGFGFFQHLPHALASLLLAAVAIGLALAIRQAWLRSLLGAAAAGLVGLALMERSLFRSQEWETAWLAAHLLLAVAALSPWWQGRWRGHGAALESLLSGWWLAVLASLAVLAGMTFLVGGVFGGGLAAEIGREVAGAARQGVQVADVLRGVSALLALGAGVLVWRAWPGARGAALVAAVVCAALLSFFMSTLGGTLLALACLAVAGRWRLAAAAGVAVAWIVGAFYYALAWDLATKALVLVGVGALLGGAAWWRRTPSIEATAGSPRAALDRRAWYVGGATAATLLVAASAIWQKQELIANGQPVFVRLAPVDPRSLMQGDYMRLNFNVPPELLDQPPSATAERPKVVATRDARGVATLMRVAKPGETLAANELLFELTPKGGGWVLVSDAWFFREGDAERWEKARYGEFRVMLDGRALLVGMADEQLQPIKP